MKISRTTTGLLPAMALIGLFALMGCQNTAEGVAQDTAKNTEATKEAASEAGQAAAKAASDAGQAAAKTASDAGQAAAQATQKMGDAAAGAGKEIAGGGVVTPQVKLAIAADSDLNDPKNKIDVDTADGVVHLKGHVINNALKKKAGEIAEKSIKDSKRTDKVVNQLLVQP
ncbi:MAG: BON domain-containing protein [Armatimonas sp.]